MLYGLSTSRDGANSLCPSYREYFNWVPGKESRDAPAPGATSPCRSVGAPGFLFILGITTVCRISGIQFIANYTLLIVGLGYISSLQVRMCLPTVLCPDIELYSKSLVLCLQLYLKTEDQFYPVFL